jgi:hypothetical protein
MRQAWPKATSGAAQEARQRRPARLARLAAQIDPAKLQHVEGIQAMRIALSKRVAARR